jgi:hypothetical protein
MKNLTATICLTAALLFGSAGESSALPKYKRMKAI